MYISDGVVTERFIDTNLEKIIENNLDAKNDLKFDNYSKELARALGLSRYYDYVYTADDGFSYTKTFSSVNDFFTNS